MSGRRRLLALLHEPGGGDLRARRRREREGDDDGEDPDVSAVRHARTGC